MMNPHKNRIARLALATTAFLAVGTMTIATTANAAPRKARAAKSSKSARPTAAYRSVPDYAAVMQRPATELYLSTVEGRLITMPEPISDVMISNPKVADVQVRSPNQIFVFAKEDGNTSMYATTPSGRVVYSANIHVMQRVNSVEKMLKTVMPESDIQVTMMESLLVLTGTVNSPEDEQAAIQMARGHMGLNPVPDPGAKENGPYSVISRIKVATPTQVMLQVKIAEVNRSFANELSSRISGNNAANPFGGTDFSFLSDGDANGLSLSGRFLGLNLAGALRLAESDGLLTTLAQPNVTAISGKQADFTVGGEFPYRVFVPNGSGAPLVSYQFKPYGVQLKFTANVKSNGRILLDLQPEVSDLDLSFPEAPGILTRRVNTSVELGSGQSMMIGGLLRNRHNTSIKKLPGIGSLPVIGALFRSNAWQRNESELMIIVTPYLVKPVNANNIALPTDGYQSPTDAQRMITGDIYKSTQGRLPPRPSVGPPVTINNAGQGRGSQPNAGAAPSASPGFES